MFADWKRKGNVSYTVSCSCVYVCARARVYACVCTWICVMCVCMSGGWVCLTIPVTPVSAPINTHRKNYIAPLYIEWRISCHTPPPIPTAGTQLTHRTSSCACHPTLSPRAFHLAKRSMLEQALRELWVRATQGEGEARLWILILQRRCDVRTFVCLDNLSRLNIKHVHGPINSTHSNQMAIWTLSTPKKRG